MGQQKAEDCVPQQGKLRTKATICEPQRVPPRQVLQSGVQGRLSVYRHHMRDAGVAFEGTPAGPEDCVAQKQTPRAIDQDRQ